MKQLIVREYLRVSKDSKQTGKSPDQQHAENVTAFSRQGWTLHPDPPYRDTDRSASRFARTVREDFKRLISDLENDSFRADVLAIWESSRGSRRVGEWVDLVDLCKQRRVRIWVTTHGRLYDPANARDRRSLLEDAVDAEYESDKSSERIRRDVRSAAEAGKPHGKNIYGYQRVYNQQTGELKSVEPHPVQAPIVQEAAQRILQGDSFYAVAKSFNERGIEPRRPTRKDHRKDLGWTAPAVKQMLTMPAYAGKRQHRDEIIGDAIWPSPDTLATLSQHPDTVAFVAGNPSTPSATLSRLVRHEDELVREALASNPNLSEAELAILSLDRHEEVRKCVADNPQTAIHTLEILANDFSSEIKAVARTALTARTPIADHQRDH